MCLRRSREAEFSQVSCHTQLPASTFTTAGNSTPTPGFGSSERLCVYCSLVFSCLQETPSLPLRCPHQLAKSGAALHPGFWAALPQPLRTCSATPDPGCSYAANTGILVSRRTSAEGTPTAGWPFPQRTPRFLTNKSLSSGALGLLTLTCLTLIVLLLAPYFE